MVDIVLLNPQKVGNLKGEIQKKSLNLPQGLLYISTLLDREGYKIKIINQDLDLDYSKNLKEYIKKKPICLGIRSTSGPQLKIAMEMVSYAKSIDPDLPVVIGGPHASLFPRWCIQKGTIDFVVPQEGEIAFYNLIRALESRKRSFSKIKGLYLKNNGKIIFTGRGPIIDLDKFPTLPYHLADVKGILLTNKKIPQDTYGKKMLDYISSRGCSNKCTFCVIQKTKWRAMSPKRMLNDIIFLKQKYGVNYIKFTDDNFITDKKRIRNFSKLIIKEKIDIKWHIKTRIDSFLTFDDCSMKLFKHAGLTSIKFGAESGSQRILNMLNKKITVKQILLANQKAVKYQLRTFYTFLLNLPTETIDDVIKSFSLALELIRENPRAIFYFGKYVPYPGMELYKKFLKQFTSPIGGGDGGCWKRRYNNPNIDQKKVEQIIRTFETMKAPRLLYLYLRRRLLRKRLKIQRGSFPSFPEVYYISHLKKVYRILRYMMSQKVKKKM